MIGIMVVLLMPLSSKVNMVLVLRRVGPVLGTWIGMCEQNYVALLQGSEISAGLHSRNLIIMFKDNHIERILVA